MICGTLILPFSKSSEKDVSNFQICVNCQETMLMPGLKYDLQNMNSLLFLVREVVVQMEISTFTDMLYNIAKLGK